MDAVRSVLPAGARHVLDLGAGTGKLTSVLLDLGLDVIAVEPDDAMRALVDPRATGLAGTAERVPLADASIDGVLVGQAWHWFDPASAVAEVRRVLRPGGTLGLLWNLLDDGVPWCAEVARLVGMEDRLSALGGNPGSDSDGGDPDGGDPDGGDPDGGDPDGGDSDGGDPPAAGFGWTRHVEAFGQPADVGLLLDNLRSRSVMILRTPDERAALLAAVRTVIPPGSFEVPWVCVAWRGEPLP